MSSGAWKFLAAHDPWTVDARMKLGARSAHERRLQARVLQWGFEVDELNIKNSAAMEYVNRRRVLHEDAHSGDPFTDNWAGNHHCVGEEEKGGASAGGTEALRLSAAQGFSERDCQGTPQSTRSHEAKKDDNSFEDEQKLVFHGVTLPVPMPSTSTVSVPPGLGQSRASPSKPAPRSKTEHPRL